ERFGYPGRTATHSIEHHLDRRSVDAMRPIGAVDRVLEGPRRVANITDSDFDVVFIVEAKGRVITQARFADGEVEALRDQIALIHDAERPQKSDAANLREHQVIRVVDDRLQVSLTEAHPLAMREWKIHAAWQVNDLACHLLPPPIWLHQHHAITTRPSESIATSANASLSAPHARHPGHRT